MFTKKHNECVGFESCWKVKRVYSVSDTQTSDFEVADKTVNTTPKECIMVQTDPLPTPSLIEGVDMNKVAGFLKELYPDMKKAIDDCNNSKAFVGYRKRLDKDEVNCKLLQTFGYSKLIEESGDEGAKRVSCMSWNQSGQSLACCRGFEHESWCYHRGTVYVYTMASNGKFSDQPKKVLNADNCVVSIKFHPTRSGLLAGTTYSGNIIVWNLQNNNGEEAVISKNVHDELVTQVSWTNDVDPEKSILLATTSTDGLLKLWRFNPLGKTQDDMLSLRVRYKIKPPLLNNGNVRKAEESEEYPRNVVMKDTNGVVCFDFSKHFPDTFLVGLEGGFVVQCSLLGATELKGSTKANPLFDPSFKYYEPVEGEIVSLAFSPNRKDQFLTYGTNAEIRIYLIGQEDPAQMIFLKTGLLDVTFVPFEDKLLAGCGANGFMEVFHIQSAERIATGTEEPVKKSVSTSISINCSRNNLVAIGKANGDVQLWNVPWSSLQNRFD
ncbi:unnamed protein product [Phyllotreta striolata]|uniref:Dynein axonemal intermediate chain 4 n=1 Tax=Phyllotreta striolata TaxID=444603 RepID=A0A9N9XQD1_PHYSR|nr:unnamed protein product [Phyllotreta striolata]